MSVQRFNTYEEQIKFECKDKSLEWVCINKNAGYVEKEIKYRSREEIEKALNAVEKANSLHKKFAFFESSDFDIICSILNKSLKQNYNKDTYEKAKKEYDDFMAEINN
jgi:hypothetical protein